MKILIVVDAQNDFIYGPLGNNEAQAIIPHIQQKINDESYEVVFFTRDTHYDNYLDTQEGRNLPVKHCIKNTEGWQIISNLYSGRDSYPVVNKSSFGYTDWQYELETFAYDYEITEIELCGVMTNICVVSNALILKALYPEVKISVDSAACAGTTPAEHEAALTVMRNCQINVY